MILSGIAENRAVETIGSSHGRKKGAASVFGKQYHSANIAR